MIDTVRVDSIVIPERRKRDVGDIVALAASINRVGLLHPVVIDDSRTLIAGYRRLQAVQTIGWNEVPVNIIQNLDDALAYLIAERDENNERKGLKPTEAAELAKLFEPLEKEAAAERQKATQGNRQSGAVKFTGPEKGDSGDKIATAVGMSRPTLAKAKAVTEAAEAHPKEYGDLAKKMDDTGNVSAAYNELADRQEQPKAPKVKLPHKPKKKAEPEAEATAEELPPPPTPIDPIAAYNAQLEQHAAACEALARAIAETAGFDKGHNTTNDMAKGHLYHDATSGLLRKIKRTLQECRIAAKRGDRYVTQREADHTARVAASRKGVA